MRRNKYGIGLLPLFSLLLSACSSTSGIPEGEQLFTGLKKIEYTNYEKCEHAAATQEEMEYALASAPNGALFGSSYYRSPFQFRLWVWNAFSKSGSKFGKWMVRAFGSQPKLMSRVNPELRASVAESQLRKYGYFNGRITHSVITQANPKKAKVAYTVNMGRLWTLDSILYVNFPPSADSLLRAHRSENAIHKGDPFSVPKLEKERQRVGMLFRDNGYYYYKPGDASYLADTIHVPGKVQIRLQMADSLEPRVMRKWYIGSLKVNFRRSFMEQLEDSILRRRISVHFNGRRPPLRMGALLHDVKLRPGRLYSYANEQATNANLLNTGLYSYTSLQFAPRDSSLTCDTLDMTLDLVLDKPYDFYIEANAKGKTTGRLGPELILGLTKRNALRGGEKFDIKLNGSYEWTTGHHAEGSSSGINSYEYGGNASLIFPRLVTPRSLLHSWRRNPDRRQDPGRPRHEFYQTPTTTLKAYIQILNRASYFKRHVISGELTYDYWTSARSHHSFSPLTLSYQYMHSRTADFLQLLEANPYLSVSMRDQFVPKMSYSYTYSTASTSRNPITWSSTISEAGNVLAASYALFGEKWDTKDKTMFKNPFAQFVKLETDFTKEWRFPDQSSLVGHLAAGVIFSYGNATQPPYYEQFYIGGANSVRAFNVRSVGPGKYFPRNSKLSYIEQTGDLKFQMNLEYRPHLFGSLFGALFLDAGNVWSVRSDDSRQGAKFEAKNFLRQMALGTGVGLRYDVGMFVVRLDWGIGLHVPYDTAKGGFYNIPSFRDGQSIHLAVGYPF